MQYALAEKANTGAVSREDAACIKMGNRNLFVHRNGATPADSEGENV
jgi:hypothetical protein